MVMSSNRVARLNTNFFTSLFVYVYLINEIKVAPSGSKNLTCWHLRITYIAGDQRLFDDVVTSFLAGIKKDCPIKGQSN